MINSNMNLKSPKGKIKRKHNKENSRLKRRKVIKLSL